MRAAAAAICWFLLAQAASSGPPELHLPMDCVLGETCYIQNYVDADPSPDYRDFACGALSYDGHKGTDFALPSHRDALAGVAVLAAAPGEVTALRDGLDDHFLGGNPAFPQGQDCGNGVVIAHGDGWETQYCHLARGSIAVRVGQPVSTGAVLGRVGMSGRTEFPHLHLSLRHDGAVVDPFDPAPDGACGAADAAQLWQHPVAYGEGGLLQAGFSSAVPDFDEVKFGQAHQPEIATGDGALVLWGHFYGTRAGDELHMTIEGPRGPFFEHTVIFERDQAQAMRAGGRRLHAENSVPGLYRGEVILLRDGAEIGRGTHTTVLGN